MTARRRYGPAFLNFLIAGVLLGGTLPIVAAEINLNASEIFITEGFELEWVGETPDLSKLYRIAASPGGRAIRMNRLRELTGAPGKVSLFRDSPERHFTLFQHFSCDTSEFPPSSLSGLSLAAIGDNWEVYLNGVLLHSEFDLNTDGSIRRHRQSRRVLIPLSPNLLIDGRNTLVFHLYGDIESGRMGLFRSSPYLIADYRYLERKNSEIYILVLMSVFLAFGIYHLNLFFVHRRDTFNLLFAVSSVAYFTYSLSRTAYIESLFRDTFLLIRIEYISLYLIFPLFGSLFEIILLKRISRFMKGVTVFNALLIAATLVCSMPAAFMILNVWQVAAVLSLIHVVFYLFPHSFIRDYRAVLKEENRGHLRALSTTLTSRESGNLAIGGIIVISCILFDIIDSMFMAKMIQLSRYGFTLTVLGIEMIQSNRYLREQNRLKLLYSELGKKVEALDHAYSEKSISEQRYRFIVAGSAEIFFSLDSELRILTCNDTVNLLLFYNPREIIGRNFIELIHPGETGTHFSKDLFREKLESLSKEAASLSFGASFRSAYMGEPVELFVTLEHISIAGKSEIIGRMRKQEADSLLHYFNSEKQCYVISNYLYLAEDVAHRLTRNIARYADRNTYRLCRTALREMIMNAIEHGNLRITFDEKTECFKNDDFRQLIKQRQSDPDLSRRCVEVSADINREYAEFTVTDEGEGFDARAVIAEEFVNFNNASLPHGRGITLTRNIFDLVEYNEKGNSVRLVKYFNSKVPA